MYFRNEDGGFGCCTATAIIAIGKVSSGTTIGQFAFYFCSKFVSITISNPITSIGFGAFANCRNLISIEIPNSVTSIGDGVFSYCLGLISVTIPSSVTSIGNQVFDVCISLQQAFLGCGLPYDRRVSLFPYSPNVKVLSECSDAPTLAPTGN